MKDSPPSRDTIGCVVVVEPSDPSEDTFKGYIVGINRFGEGHTKVEFVDENGDCRTTKLEKVICYGKNIMDFAGQPAGYVGEYSHSNAVIGGETRVIVKAADENGAVIDFPDSSRPSIDLPLAVLVAYVETGRYQRV